MWLLWDYGAYSAKTETRDEAFVKEAIGEEGYGWNCIYDRENIVELEWAFSGFMVGLQLKWF